MQMPLEIRGLQREIVAIGPDCVGIVLCLFVQVPQIITYLQFGRAHGEDLVQLLDGLGVLLLLPIDKSHSKLGIEIRRILGQYLLQLPQCFVILLRRHLQTNKMVPDVPIFRIHSLQVAAIDLDRLLTILRGFIHRPQGYIGGFKRRIQCDRLLEVRCRLVEISGFDADATQIVVPDCRVRTDLDPGTNRVFGFDILFLICQQQPFGKKMFATLRFLLDRTIE